MGLARWRHRQALSATARSGQPIHGAHGWGLGLWAYLLLPTLAARGSVAGGQSYARECPRWRPVPGQRHVYHGHWRCLRFYLRRLTDPFRGQRLYCRAGAYRHQSGAVWRAGGAGVVAMEPGRHLAVAAICLVGFSPAAYLHWHWRSTLPVSFTSRLGSGVVGVGAVALAAFPRTTRVLRGLIWVRCGVCYVSGGSMPGWTSCG